MLRLELDRTEEVKRKNAGLHPHRRHLLFITQASEKSTASLEVHFSANSKHLEIPTAL
jgi:hypothetical protein